jgi:hypothetical protein
LTATFSKDVGEITLKQMRNTSVYYIIFTEETGENRGGGRRKKKKMKQKRGNHERKARGRGKRK